VISVNHLITRDLRVGDEDGETTMKIGNLDMVNLYVGNDEASKVYVGNNAIWEKPSSGYWGLCFTAEQANSTVALFKYGEPPAITLQTSTDGETWTPYTIGDTITLANVGDKVYFAAGSGGNATFSTFTTTYYGYAMTGSISASGNIMSLLDKDNQLDTIPCDHCFYSLFKTCTTLTTAPELPATTLTGYCYLSMFMSCIALTTAPELPATTLAPHCYNKMFRYCSALTTAPELPATTLDTQCYVGIFAGCTNLTSIRVRFTEWNPSDATKNWVQYAGTEATGTKTFYCPSALTETFGNNNIPTGWTVVRTDT